MTNTIEFQAEKDNFFLLRSVYLKKSKEIRKALFGLDYVAKHISIRDAFISYFAYNKKKFFKSTLLGKFKLSLDEQWFI